MFSQMSNQAKATRKCLIANMTRIRFFTSVRPEVNIQANFLNKFSIAKCTLNGVSPVSRVISNIFDPRIRCRNNCI